MKDPYTFPNKDVLALNELFEGAENTEELELNKFVEEIDFFSQDVETTKNDDGPSCKRPPSNK